MILPELHGRAPRRAFAAALVLAAGWLLAMAPASGAHAAFKSVAPADAAALKAAPKSIVIEFTKDVGDNVREATLVPPSGKDITDAWTADGASITIAAPKKMTAGTWGVRWRVLGADGHPLTGASTFTIAAPAEAPNSGTDTSPAPKASTPATSTPPEPSSANHAGHSMMSSYPHDTLERVALAGRVLFFGGLLLFVGGVIFAIFAAPGWQPRYWNRTLVATVLGAIIVVGTHAAMLDERSVLGMLNPIVWIKDMVSVGVRGYVLAAIIVLVMHVLRWQLEPIEWEERDAAKPTLLMALVIAAAAAPSLSGHAVDGTMLWVRMPLDMLHVLAGAAWLGGLVQLLTITVRQRSRDPRMVAVVNRYSRIAGASVAILVVTGVYATLNELGAGIGELVGSTWGRLILLKVLLLVATLPLANANRLRHVPSVSRDPVRGVPQLRRFVALELLVIVWVVGATSMLVYESPPTSAAASTHAVATK